MMGYGSQLGKQCSEGHAVLQGGGGSILNNRTVGHRVTKGNAYFYHVNASLLHGENHVTGTIEGRGSGTEIERQELLIATMGKKGINLIHLQLDNFFVIIYFY